MAPDPQDAADVIGARAPGFSPRVGLVLGTGIGALAEAIEGAVIIDYGDLPGFPLSAGKTYGDTASAPENENPLIIEYC